MSEAVPYRFVLVAHSQDLVDSVRRVADCDGYTLDWRIVDCETAVPVARQCLEADAEVIICHGGTGNKIMRALANSAVLIDRADMDVIKAIRAASRVDRDIILAAHQDEHHDIAVIEELLDVRIPHAAYSDTRKLFATFEDLYANGVRVPVRGGVTKQSMDSIGGRGFIIAANRHCISKTLLMAKTLAGQRARTSRGHGKLSYTAPERRGRPGTV